jgi:hypothetical protein
MKVTRFAIAIALAAGLTAPAADASWRYGGEHYAQAPKGQGGGREGRERAQSGREARPDRPPERGANDRPERLNDDERRALHRDLDKANRELYQGRK